MVEQHVVIIGGGLAGLSAGCYARRNGLKTTILEHNLALGGVCTAWTRGEYTIDGCIQWLTGGPFRRIYEELGIIPAVPLRTLETWTTYRNIHDGIEVAFTRKLDKLVAQLTELGRDDADELRRLRDGVAQVAALKPSVDAPELAGVSDTIRSLWEMRGALAPLVHFRRPIGVWAREHLRSPRLQRLFTKMMPETMPTFFLLMGLAYLEQGFLSRPVGGTAAFRDALVHAYESLGGAVQLHATVDEVLIENGRASGVRLADGTMIGADYVISTASAPETVLRLLGGRYDAETTRERMAKWKMFDPIVLASFGVAATYDAAPSILVLDGLPPFLSGERSIETLSIRVCNDDPSFAPRGHTVIQALVPADYEWWATRGSHYGAAKDALADTLLTTLSPHFRDMRAAIRMTDIATPLTFWGMARSWRGAYEGWMPNAESVIGHVKKKLSGLEGFYMAGQWVEPGGGVPTAVMSGRQAIQLLCSDQDRSFVSVRPM